VYPQKFITVPPPERVYSYGLTAGGIGGLMYVVAGQPGVSPWARFELQSQCFKLPEQAPSPNGPPAAAPPKQPQVTLVHIYGPGGHPRPS
jgi:hypothetical protein